MIELDKNLTPVDSLAAEQGAVDPYKFGFQNEDGVISAAKILNFNFNAGTGGTLTLGGTANGNGLMNLKDASGSIIFSGDYLGHHYYNGLGTEQVRVDASGLHNYNAGGTEQIRVDFTGFHAYGTAGTANELIKVDNTGLNGYLASGSKTLNVGGLGINGYGQNGDTFQFYNNEGGTLYGQIGFLNYSGTPFFTFSGTNGAHFFFDDDQNTIGFYANGLAAVTTQFLLLGGSVGVAIETGGSGLLIDGTIKSAIVPTSEGYRALYTNESPDVWFMDFYKGSPDPMFIEVTTSPYHEIECKDGFTQIWGKRKGFKNTRFESKTEKQFNRNNDFWAYPDK